MLNAKVFSAHAHIIQNRQIVRSLNYVQISNFVGIFGGLGKLYIFENYMA